MLKRIRSLFSKPYYSCQVDSGFLILNEGDQKIEIELSSIRSVQYTWSLAVGFTHGVIINFGLDTECVLSDEYLKHTNLLELFEAELAEFPRIENIEHLINDDGGDVMDTVDLWPVNAT